MMLLEWLFAIGLVWLGGALIAGYIAYSYGRSFWRWCLLGLLLPYLSLFVVMLVVYRAARAEEQKTDG